MSHLLTPGPVPLPEKVRQSLSQPVIHHRTKEFESDFVSCLKLLPKVFSTSQSVMMITATGSGGMEAAIVNTLSTSDSVIVVNSGKFGSRWKNIAVAYGLTVYEYFIERGKNINLNDFSKFVNEHKNAQALLVQACETSTGQLHPIKEISAIVKKINPQMLNIVDGITAVGATPLQMDEWNIDVLIAGSQKAFMLPTGMAFISLSALAWERQVQSNLPKFYFDLMQERKANLKKQTHFSSSVHHIRALAKVLPWFLQEDKPNILQVIENNSRLFRDSVVSLGFKLFAENPSPTLSVIQVPENVDGVQWLKQLHDDFGLTLMGGQDELKGKILRVGHMGAISLETMIILINALYKTFCQYTQMNQEESKLNQVIDVYKENWMILE